MQGGKEGARRRRRLLRHRRRRVMQQLRERLRQVLAVAVLSLEEEEEALLLLQGGVLRCELEVLRLLGTAGERCRSGEDGGRRKSLARPTRAAARIPQVRGRVSDGAV